MYDMLLMFVAFVVFKVYKEYTTSIAFDMVDSRHKNASFLQLSRF